MKNLHTPTNQPSPFYPDTGKDRRSPLGLTKFVDVSGIEPEALTLLRLWIGHLALLKQKTFSPENTPLFVIYLVDAGV